MRTTWILIAAASLALPDLAAAQATERVHKAPNKYRAIASKVDGSDIQVYPQPPANGRDYFCAAADYAVRFLGASKTDRLVVTVPETSAGDPNGRKSVHFAVVSRNEAPDLPGAQGSIDPRRAGENRNVGASQQFCFRSQGRNKNK